MDPTFVELLERKEAHQIEEYLKKKLELDKNDPFYSNWGDYHILKSLLQMKLVDNAKFCIKQGFRVNMKPRIYNDNTPLHEAVKLKDSDIVEMLLEREASTSAKNDNDDTPLTLAARLMNNEIVIDMLLSKITSENHSNREEFSHLHVACMRNNVSVVKKLLQSGASVDDYIGTEGSDWYCYNPLIFAAVFDCPETVKLLLECGADLNHSDRKTCTALHLAFRKGNERIVDTILCTCRKYSANCSDEENLTHFHIACARDNLKVVKEFIRLKLPIDDQIDCDNSNWPGYNGLRFAVEYNSMNVLRFLLENNSMDFFKETVTDLMEHAYSKGNTVIFNLLQLNVQKFSITLSSTKLFEKLGSLELSSSYESSKLHASVIYNKDDMASILESYPADILERDSEFRTPLHHAFENNRRSIIDKMLAKHVEIQDNPTNRNGLSHFHISCTCNNIRVISDFLDKGANINSMVNLDDPFWPGFTPLHFAVKYGCEVVVPFLLNQGADVTHRNGCNLLPLDMAISRLSVFLDASDEKYLRIAEELLSASQNYCSPCNRGLTLLHIACARNDTEAIASLASPLNINLVVDEDVPRWGGYTSLHFAAEYGNMKAIKLLLDSGANMSITNATGNVPAHLLIDCISYKNDRDHRLLLCNKNYISDDGISLFHLACLLGEIQAVHHFLDLGVNINEKSISKSSKIKIGTTALHLAVQESYGDIVDLLLNRGADVNATDALLCIPLHYCLDIGIFHKLINEGADVNFANWNLATPALTVFQMSNVNIHIMNAFFSSDMDVNFENRGGDTPFTVINVKSTNPELDKMIVGVKYICRMKVLGIDISAKNKDRYAACLLTLQERNVFNEKKFIEMCTGELQKMKKLRINNYTRLYDLLFYSPQKMLRLLNNDNYKEIIALRTLEINFPIYGHLLISKYEKSLFRQCLLEKSTKALEILVKHYSVNVQFYGDFMIEIILQHLTNKDLKNLIQASYGLESYGSTWCVNAKGSKLQKVVDTK